MANQKILAVIFALSAAAVKADNCNKVHAAYVLVNTTQTAWDALRCPSASTACVNTEEGCPCAGACCTMKTGICAASVAAAITAGKGCQATEYVDESKMATAVKTDFTDFRANCCSAKKTCDIACPAGMKDKTDKATIKCEEDCHESECCDIDPATCLGAMAGAMTAGKGCDIDKHYIEDAKAAAAVKADFTDYKATCCTDKITCSAKTCAAGWKDRTDKATAKCAGGTCSDVECCSPDTTKCAGAMAGAVAANKGCAASTEFTDPAKNGNAVKADFTDYKANCCSKTATCTAFKEQVLAQTTSAATTQQTPVMALLLAMGGVLVFGK